MPGFLRNFIFQRMRKKAGDLAAPSLTQSVGRLFPRDLPSRFTPRQPLRDLPLRPVQAPGLPKPPAGGRGSGGLSPAAAGGITVGGFSAGAALAGASSLLGDPFGITQALAGTAGKPNQSRMSLLGGVNTDPFVPTTTPMQRAQVGQPMVLGGRLGYKAADGSWQPRGDMESENIPQYVKGKGYVYDEPQARREPKEDSREPGSTAPPAPRISPEERAYNAERERIAQLTAQNPEFQNIDQLRNNLRDQGMAIWAAANPTLAKNLQPGQVGYDAVQQALVGNEAGQAMRQGYGFQTPQQMLMTPPPGVNAPQGLPAVSSFDATSTYGQQGLQVDPEMEKKFQALLNQAQK